MTKNRGIASVSLCCKVLNVRREGYYDWLKRPTREERDAPLISALKKVRQEHPDYGTQSMIDELPEDLKCSYGKGYRVCRDNGLLTKRRKPRCLTKPDPKAQKSEDLVNQNFTADKPGEKWLTDITEMQCKDGKAYLCGILDCFDSALLGHSFEDNMRAPLCTAALMNAQNRYGHEDDCIVHSDRGSQFTSHLYRGVLANQGFRQSMGRTGCCYDNAKMESFFATLKKELIYKLPLSKMTRAEVKLRVFAWIEGYYNRRRRHTANQGKLAPITKRLLFSQQQQQLAA
jgi:transposase InsO family protein